jgi:hypothetical protein
MRGRGMRLIVGMRHKDCAMLLKAGKNGAAAAIREGVACRVRKT